MTADLNKELEKLFLSQSSQQHVDLLASILKDLSATLTNPDKRLRQFTDLTNHEITLLSLLHTVADFYQLTSLKMFIDHLLNYKIAKNRQSRSELISIIQQTQTSLVSTLTAGVQSIIPPDQPERTSRWKFWR